MLASCNQVSKENANTTTSPDTNTVHSAVANRDTIGVTTDPIVSIRKKVERINTDSLQKQHLEFICDEKMMVDHFYRDGKIVKISVDFGTIGDVYAKEDYYYDDNKLIFKYEFIEGGPACEGCIKTNEYRSYILNNKVIKYLKDKAVQQCRQCQFTPSSKPYKLLEALTAEQAKMVMCR